MALISPGIEISVDNQSFYDQVVSSSIPYILLVTAQDKQSGTNSDIAAGTTKRNANAVVPVTSRRELLSLFGTPTFQVDSTGNVVQGHELNEYGLQTAYSLLGVTNRVYVQRADIDLSQLVGTSVRPTNDPQDGTLWFDLTNTDFGIFEWNAPDQTFNKINPIVVDDVNDTVSGVPVASIGAPGSYAVVTVSNSNPVYYKDNTGTWVLVGSDQWKSARPTVEGTVTNPVVTAGDSITINGTVITFTGTTLAQVVTDINNAAIAGIQAADVNGKLVFYVGPTAASDGVNVDESIQLATNVNTQTAFADLGITAGTYATLASQLTPHTQVPTWRTTDTQPRPTGSVWVKTTEPNLGANFVVSRFVGSVNEWQRVSTPLYLNGATANKEYDPVGGGINIPAGTMFVRYDLLEDNTVTYGIYARAVKGETVITGSVPNPTFTAGDQFTVQVSQPGFATLTAPVTITMSGVTANDFVTDVVNANIPNLTAEVTSTGLVVLKHTAGGEIIMNNVTGIPLTDAGITSSTLYVDITPAGELVASNWMKALYTASSQQPSVDPEDGTYWYYSEINEADIMIHDGSQWRGYRNVSTDARGANLTITDANGPIISASKPTTQSDGTPIELGDLWIDTSDLDNYPVIYRWTNVGGGQEDWVLIDNADQTSENGIVFADARWDTTGTRDVITDDLEPITNMLVSDYVDLDAPDPALYPRGTLLFNLRRSGFVVKQYVRDYFNAQAFTGTLPVVTDTWRTVSGLKQDGSPYMGSNAVRNMIVTAMKSAIDSSITIREETTPVNLLSAVGYPELINNLIQVNVDRKETAFVVGDSPMDLPANSLAIQEWVNNSNLAFDNGEDGLVSNYEFLGVYYPAGLTNDLEGRAAVVPSSHMALRTIINSDNKANPWIPPAGTRRGIVDNVSSIGYIDNTTGEFVTAEIGEGLRDVLYQGRVNPISVIPGVGITVMGQKTRASGASALDRINAARLVAYIRYKLAQISRPYIHEPNDKLTRDEFKNDVDRFFNELVAKRALYDYIVVCNNTNNTPARIDRNELWLDAAIEIVKASEFIYVPLRLANTGEL